MDERARAILDDIRLLSRRVWGNRLTGFYLHGSLAMGCFCWQSSDIDFIVVLDAAPSQAEKEAYVGGLVAISGYAPPKGLEMSVVTAESAKHFQHPCPYELHFSNAHLDQCRQDLAGFCRRMQGTDRDLAAHFTIIRQRGLRLHGAPIMEAFGDVPAEAYLDSLRYDIESAPEGITRDPVYFILNLCRVLAYRQEGLVLSKQEGGEWGLARLSPDDKALVEQALRCYQSGRAFPGDYPRERLQDFAHHMLERIRAE